MDREGSGNFNSGNSLGTKCAVAWVTRSGSSRTGRGVVGQKTGRIRDILIRCGVWTSPGFQSAVRSRELAAWFAAPCRQAQNCSVPLSRLSDDQQWLTFPRHCSRSAKLISHHHLVPQSWMSGAFPLFTPAYAQNNFIVATWAVFCFCTKICSQQQG